MSAYNVLAALRDTALAVCGSTAVVRVADATLPVDLSSNTLLITIAIAILGWQMRKLLRSNEELTKEMIQVRLVLFGDGNSVAGTCADIRDLAREVSKLRETRAATIHDWSIWRARVDDALTDLADDAQQERGR